MSPTREVVITGLGVVCPLGVGRDAFWAALRDGRGGISQSPLLGGGETPFRLGGYVTGFDPKEHIQPRKTIKVMCREIQFAFAAAGMAMADAALAKGQVEPNRFGVVLGSELLYGEVEELFATFRQCREGDGFHVERFAENAMKEIFPLWMLKYLPNMAACHIGIAHDARGPNNSIVAGAVSSLNAVHEARCYIERGQADAMIAGGAGSLVSFNGFAFRGWKHLSKSLDPAEAPLPLDARRDGSLPGEGCGMLVLESREHAERRGATILGRIAGFASRCEPLAPGTAPTGSAIRASISAALAQAGVTPSSIGCVSAAAGGDLLADAREAQAIRAELGDAPVTAVKGGMGDLGAGTGAVELAAAVLALHHGLAPPTVHFQTPDPLCPVQVVSGSAQPFAQPAVIKISHNPTGQAAALVVTRN